MQLVFCKKKTMWFIGVEVEQETNAPPPKKKILNPPLDRSQNFVSDGQFPNHALNSHIKRVNFETKIGIS